MLVIVTKSASLSIQIGVGQIHCLVEFIEPPFRSLISAGCDAHPIPRPDSQVAPAVFIDGAGHDLLIGGEHFRLDIPVRLLQIRLAPHFIDRIRGAVQIQGDDGIADAFFAANPMCPDWSNLPNCRL